MNGKNWLTSVLSTLGAFGDNFKDNGRPRYPYQVGEKSPRAGRQRHHTKKGPGRIHARGVTTQVRRAERKLRSCAR